MRISFIFSAMLLLVGCTGAKTLSCGDKALLLWPDVATQAYRFQTVEFSTLSSLYNLKGPAAEVYYEAGLDDSGFQGPVAQPHLTGAGGVCVPEDVASSLVLSAYAQFERLFQFEEKLGTAAQLSWPRKVGVDIHLIGDEEAIHNNAHYYGVPDVMVVAPYTRGHLPMALNVGVVAHEHFHAHFQHEVLARVNAQLPMTIDAMQSSNPQSNGSVNGFTLRGWNEGVADFFAAVYTRRPDFLSVSVPAPDRDLSSGPVLPLLSGAGMQIQALANVGLPLGRTLHNMNSVAYGQGTQLARVMWHLAHSGSESPESFLRRILFNLKNLPAVIEPVYKANALIDGDSVLAPLLKGYEWNEESCALLSQVASLETLRKEFAACMQN
jgi:hypothetical protein